MDTDVDFSSTGTGTKNEEMVIEEFADFSAFDADNSTNNNNSDSVSQNGGIDQVVSSMQSLHLQNENVGAELDTVTFNDEDDFPDN